MPPFVRQVGTLLFFPDVLRRASEIKVGGARE
jgi:hypothetical protein